MHKSIFLVTYTLCFSCSFLEEGPGNGNKSKITGYPSPEWPVPEANLSLTMYQDCQELQDDIRGYLVEKEELRRAYNQKLKDWEYENSPGNRAQVQSGMVNDQTPSADSNESFTNIQEKGIDEPDLIKIGEIQIYILRNDTLITVDRESLEEIGQIEIKGASKIFYHKGKLSVIGVENQSFIGLSSYTNYDSSYNQSAPRKTFVKVFKEVKGKVPKAIYDYQIEAEHLDSRLKDGMLILVSNSYLPFKEGYEKANAASGYDQQFDYIAEPIEVVKGQVQTVPCEQIVKRPHRDEDFSMLVVTALDLNSPELSYQTNATIGGGSQIYMGPEGLYISKTDIFYPHWIYESSQYNASQVITKVRLTSENSYPMFTARGIIDGYTKDQYSFKEYPEENVLAVATTTFERLEKTSYINAEIEDVGEGRNHLFTLVENDGELKVTKLIKNFGEPDDDIRSVRFTDDRAYVVTFKKTDPLYSFDLSNPSTPELTGELKIPGFSSYMHPINEQTLLGVGYDALEMGDFAYFQGIQVSLFDVSNPEEMQRVDNVVLGKRGSSSEVTHDAKAFFLDQENLVFALPVVLLEGGKANAGPAYGSERTFSGAIFYEVVGDSLSEVNRVSHIEFIPRECRKQMDHGEWWQNKSVSLDINRIYKVDDHYLTISRFGIKQLSKGTSSEVVKSVSFESKSFNCKDYYYY